MESISLELSPPTDGYAEYTNAPGSARSGVEIADPPVDNGVEIKVAANASI